jgi:hypothetical protein
LYLFLSSFSGWVISNFVVAKHICSPCCHLVVESGSWFIPHSLANQVVLHCSHFYHFLIRNRQWQTWPYYVLIWFCISAFVRRWIRTLDVRIISRVFYHCTRWPTVLIQHQLCKKNFRVSMLSILFLWWGNRR